MSDNADAGTADAPDADQQTGSESGGSGEGNGDSGGSGEQSGPGQGEAVHLQPPETDSITGGGAPPAVTAVQGAETDEITKSADGSPNHASEKHPRDVETKDGGSS